MWANTAKWLQEKAVDVAQRANVAAEELRQSGVVSEWESKGKALLQQVVGAVEAANRGDDEALFRAIKLKYVTDRILAMAFPDPVEAVAKALTGRHGGHFMIWNISEETYDYSLFENQVLEFKFPGHPAPPLGLLIKMCTSIENWLQADPLNVVVVHCLTGKGRTATVMSALLCWLNLDVGQGVGQSLTTMQALLHVSEKLETEVDKVTIPSQRRYLQYFSNMVDGIKPRSEPLMLRRVIMNTIPRFGKPPKGARQPQKEKEAGEEGTAAAGEVDAVEEDDGILGCCPYLQLFKGGKLIFTAPCSRNGSTGDGKPASSGEVTLLPWAFPSDGSIIFAVDCVVQGDILVRSRHLSASGQKISMFRAAFHTGYVPCGVLRLSKAQLDGACTDDRFEHDFFIDLIFAPVEEPQGGVAGEGSNKDLGVAADAEDKDNYDAMLHKDTRFWNEISARKKRAAARARQAALQLKQQEQQQQSGSKTTPAAAKFSIMGDGEELPSSSQDDGLIIFDNTPRPGDLLLPPLPPQPSSSAPAPATHPAISDEDLLQELEAAENAPVLHVSPVGTTPAPLTTTTADEGSSGKEGAAAGGSVPASSAAPSQAVDLSEISALAELEKELGLDLVLPPTAATTTASGGGAAAGSSSAVVDFDDSLDDYEGFLESLNSKCCSTMAEETESTTGGVERKPSLAMQLMNLINNFTSLPAVEPILTYLVWTVHLILGPLYAVLYLGFGLWDVCNGVLVQRFEDPSSGPIVITGCDSGFGRELALTLYEKGWKVYAGCLSDKGIKELAEKGDGTLIPIKLDVTKQADIDAAVKRVEKDNPDGLFALVNNAGVGNCGAIDWVSMDSLRFVMEVNFFAVVAMSKAFVPLLRKCRRKGHSARVVNVSSMAGLFYGSAIMSAYSASKHACEAFSSALRHELYPFGIKVVTLNPTFHRTPLVKGVEGSVVDAYNTTDKATQAEYGPGYLKAACDIVNFFISGSWDPKRVLDVLVYASTGTKPGPQYLVGLDSKFFYPLVQRLPVPVYDYLSLHGHLAGLNHPAGAINGGK